MFCTRCHIGVYKFVLYSMSHRCLQVCFVLDVTSVSTSLFCTRCHIGVYKFVLYSVSHRCLQVCFVLGVTDITSRLVHFPQCGVCILFSPVQRLNLGFTCLLLKFRRNEHYRIKSNLLTAYHFTNEIYLPFVQTLCRSLHARQLMLSLSISAKAIESIKVSRYHLAPRFLPSHLHPLPTPYPTP